MSISFEPEYVRRPRRTAGPKPDPEVIEISSDSDSDVEDLGERIHYQPDDPAIDFLQGLPVENKPEYRYVRPPPTKDYRKPVEEKIDHSKVWEGYDTSGFNDFFDSEKEDEEDADILKPQPSFRPPVKNRMDIDDIPLEERARSDLPSSDQQRKKKGKMNVGEEEDVLSSQMEGMDVSEPMDISANAATSGPRTLEQKIFDVVEHIAQEYPQLIHIDPAIKNGHQDGYEISMDLKEENLHGFIEQIAQQLPDLFKVHCTPERAGASEEPEAAAVPEPEPQDDDELDAAANILHTFKDTARERLRPNNTKYNLRQLRY